MLTGFYLVPEAQSFVSPQVSAGYGHTVGLKSDGTVVAVGANDFDQCNVSSRTDIVQVSAGWYHTVGLKSDSTVVAVGDNFSGQCNVTDMWKLCEEPTVIKLVTFTAVPKAGKVIIQWTTESEIENAGFNLYHSESEDSVYQKINGELIPTRGSAMQGASYEYVDTEVRKGKPCYYKLEDIDLHGRYQPCMGQ